MVATLGGLAALLVGLAILLLPLLATELSRPRDSAWGAVMLLLGLVEDWGGVNPGATLTMTRQRHLRLPPDAHSSGRAVQVAIASRSAAPAAHASRSARPLGGGANRSKVRYPRRAR